jgi:KDO2-lipid IV(A) lauroyltransferase
VRLLAGIPLAVLYGLSSAIGWLTFHVFPYREKLVRQHLTLAFPEKSPEEIRDIMRRYYAGFADMLMEIVKSATLPAEEIRRRVHIDNLPELRALLAKGQSLLLVAAHQCNWEWMLLGLSLQLGCPLEAAYKPLVDGWAQREMLKARSRFGAQLVPAQELLAHILRGGRTPRAIAMVADQEPRTSERRHWTRFMNRDTAFFMGAEEITRVTKFPAFFVGLRRTRRGHYTVSATALAQPGEKLAPGALTERYARLVEAQIEASPADWPWSHKRWKLKKSLYAG